MDLQGAGFKGTSLPCFSAAAGLGGSRGERRQGCPRASWAEGAWVGGGVLVCFGIQHKTKALPARSAFGDAK